jgi:hypothetical protein
VLARDFLKLPGGHAIRFKSLLGLCGFVGGHKPKSDRPARLERRSIFGTPCLPPLLRLFNLAAMVLK